MHARLFGSLQYHSSTEKLKFGKPLQWFILVTKDYLKIKIEFDLVLYQDLRSQGVYPRKILLDLATGAQLFDIFMGCVSYIDIFPSLTFMDLLDSPLPMVLLASLSCSIFTKIFQCLSWFQRNYSKVSNKRTVFNNRTGGDIILQKF